MEETFARKRFLWQFFVCLFVFVFFWTFESTCLLPSGLQIFWWERNLMVILLRVISVWSHLSWCSQDCLFSWLLKVWECFSVGLLVHLTWSWLNFLDIYIYVLYQTWEIFSRFFSNILSSFSLFFFGHSHNTYVSLTNGVPQVFSGSLTFIVMETWATSFGITLDSHLGCIILYKVKMKSFSHVWLFATPWTVADLVSLSMGFSRQEYWNGLPFPSPGYLPNPGIEPRSPAL